MVSIQLDPDTERRLAELAKQAGQTTDELARELLEWSIEFRMVRRAPITLAREAMFQSGEHAPSAPGRMTTMNDASLHEAIISCFLEHQRPPTFREIAERFQRDEARARHALRTLADHHGVVLHPHSDEVWIAHPFSAAPTTCVVKSGNQKWWGNCVWCSLGLVHLAGGSATIETRIGAIGDHATIRIENGKLLDTDYIVHLPIPMKNAWDNVIYTCSIQLLFHDEAQVDEWCASRGIPKGDVRPIEQVWSFAAEWYARHADADWTKWTARQAIEIFARHHLNGPVWTLSDEAARF